MDASVLRLWPRAYDPLEDAMDALPLTPADLAGRVGALLKGLPAVAVRGRLVKGSQSSAGHVYFTVTDGRASFRCVMYRGLARRLTADLADGAAVTVTGTVALYGTTGSVQLVVREVTPAGAAGG